VICVVHQDPAPEVETGQVCTGVDPVKAPTCTCPDVDASTGSEPFATIKGLDRHCPQHGTTAVTFGADDHA
jgi:hypothetical protein